MTSSSPRGPKRSKVGGLVAFGHRVIPFKRHIYDPIRRTMPRGLKQRLRPVRFTGTMTVHVDDEHGFLLTADGSRLTNDLYWRGYGQGWEGMSLRLWRHFAPHAQTILDVGAQAGIYALAAKCRNPQAVVVAFEPLASSFAMLRLNVDLNEYDILMEQVAVSDATGTATLYDPIAHHGLASIEARPDVPHVEITTPTVRLDDFARDRGLQRIDLVKIDIEGHEPAAIRGLGDYLTTSSPPILVEILSDGAGAATWEIVKQHGYQAYLLDDVNGVFTESELKWVSNKKRNYLLSNDDVLRRTGLSKQADGSYALPALVSRRA